MNKIKIFTDSTADLSKDLIDRYHISIIPLYVTLNDQSYRDGVDQTTQDMYTFIDKTQTLPKTSAPTVEDFKSAFLPWIDEGCKVIYIGLSSSLSSTFQSAFIASQDLEEGKVFLIDSLNLSTGIGLLVLKAAELAEQGLDAETIAKIISEDVSKIRSSFIIDTLKYLHMGGRCSSVQLLAGNLLKIRPQIIVKDGGMVVGGKYRGNRRTCLDRFFQDHVGDGSSIDPHRVFITHSACSEEDVQYLKEKLQSLGCIEEILVTQAGTVISSHCGSGTIGILYIEK